MKTTIKTFWQDRNGEETCKRRGWNWLGNDPVLQGVTSYESAETETELARRLLAKYNKGHDTCERIPGGVRVSLLAHSFYGIDSFQEITVSQ